MEFQLLFHFYFVCFVFLHILYISVTEKKNENSQIILNECVRHVRKYYIKKEDKSTRKRNHKQRINVVMEETSDFFVCCCCCLLINDLFCPLYVLNAWIKKVFNKISKVLLLLFIIIFGLIFLVTNKTNALLILVFSFTLFLSSVFFDCLRSTMEAIILKLWETTQHI